MNNNRFLEQYHYQASEDIFAKQDDGTSLPGIATTTWKDIKEAYNEFIQDLLLEAQEAY